MPFTSFPDNIPDKLLPGLEKRSYFLYIAWREVCHVAGSIILLTLSHYLSLFLSLHLTPFIFGALLVWMTYQEFVLHKRLYNQKLWEGMLDWLAWITPFVLYFYLA